MKPNDPCRTCPKVDGNDEAVPGGCCADEPVSGVPATAANPKTQYKHWDFTDSGLRAVAGCAAHDGMHRVGECPLTTPKPTTAPEPTRTPEGAPGGQNTVTTMEAGFSPRLWDVPPDSVTHIAGAQLSMFGRYLRQRCDWCGVIIIEYDLTRVMVPVDQPGPPPMWPVGALVRVDRSITAVVESVQEGDHIRLPMDSCAFDPFTQVNPPLGDLLKDL